jgi:hypothetical protein
MGALSSKPVGSDVALDDGNYNSSASSAWGECDGEEGVEGAGPIYTASGKERAGIDESTADEADRDEEVDDDDDDDDDEDNESEVFDYRSSLVDVGKDDGGASEAMQKKHSKSEHVKNTVHKGRYFEVESMDVVDPTTGKRVEIVSKVPASASFVLSQDVLVTNLLCVCRARAGDRKGRDARGHAAVVRCHAHVRRRGVQAGRHLPLDEEASLLSA